MQRLVLTGISHQGSLLFMLPNLFIPDTRTYKGDPSKLGIFLLSTIKGGCIIIRKQFIWQLKKLNGNFNINFCGFLLYPIFENLDKFSNYVIRTLLIYFSYIFFQHQTNNQITLSCFGWKKNNKTLFCLKCAMKCSDSLPAHKNCLIDII